MSKTITAEDYRLQGNFELARKTLLDASFRDRLDRPLAFWALPSDRRLPIAFLGRSLGDLLATPFLELMATPGIGRKKIGSLIELLHRAIQDSPPSARLGVDQHEGGIHRNGNGKPYIDSDFDSTIVSESLWVQWCDNVRKFQLESEKLGRLTPSLQTLPTVIWHKSLGFYLKYSLAEMRSLKTHGDKRVNAVLEVFFEINRFLSELDADRSLAVRLVPKFVPPVEAWINEVLAGSEPPTNDSLCLHLATPLLHQIEIDAGPAVHHLVDGRLGISMDAQSVRAQSREVGVTRARIYQLFDDCAKIMDVRWPEGNFHLINLTTFLAEASADAKCIAMLKSIRDLFYPEKRDTLDRGDAESKRFPNGQ